MGWQHALVAGLCVGLGSVGVGSASVQAGPLDGEVPAAKASAKTTPALTKRQKRIKKRKRAQKRRQQKRARAKKSNRGKKANRPDGWQWPPSEAMKAQGELCKEELKSLGVTFEQAPFTRGVANPIYVPDMAFDAITLVPTFRKPPFVIDCHLALALRQVAPVLAESGVQSLRFSSIYNYRRAIVGGKQKRSLSRHSYGLAIDVFEVERSDGDIVKVAGDYYRGELLKEIETRVNESERFRLVLSPANDPRSHSDHLHFEADVSYPEAIAEAAPGKGSKGSKGSKGGKGGKGAGAGKAERARP